MKTYRDLEDSLNDEVKVYNFYLITNRLKNNNIYIYNEIIK